MCLLAVALFVVLGAKEKGSRTANRGRRAEPLFRPLDRDHGNGHLFGVTAKLLLGTLPATIRLWIAFAFGFARSAEFQGL